MIDWSGHIRREISRAAAAVGAPLTILGEAEGEALREALCARYCADRRLGFGRDNLKDYAALHDAESFLWAAEALGARAGYLLYDSAHPQDRAVFRAANGATLREVLAECFGFQFYVADEALGFVLCSTDDDCLLGCGEARPWVEARRAVVTRG